mgnify:CR=1 FL=1
MWAGFNDGHDKIWMCLSSISYHQSSAENIQSGLTDVGKLIAFSQLMHVEDTKAHLAADVFRVVGHVWY